MTRRNADTRNAEQPTPSYIGRKTW